MNLSLSPIWGPALRIVLSPNYGLFSIHANHAIGGYEALPMDYTLSNRYGIAAFTGETMTDVVEGVRHF